MGFLAYSLSYHIVPKKIKWQSLLHICGHFYHISPFISQKQAIPKEREERGERGLGKMIMECLGLSFVNQKVTKIVSNTASICRLARRSGITREVSLRLSLYKTKAQAHRELWIYKFKMARLVAKRNPQVGGRG